jgi:hypothetical protein
MIFQTDKNFAEAKKSEKMAEFFFILKKTWPNLANRVELPCAIFVQWLQLA